MIPLSHSENDPISPDNSPAHFGASGFGGKKNSKTMSAC
jgi:hypothetical protein